MNYDDIDWKGLVVYYGIAGIIRNVIAACEEKHEYYALTHRVSSFSAYAQALGELLPVLRNRAGTIMEEGK